MRVTADFIFRICKPAGIILLLIYFLLTVVKSFFPIGYQSSMEELMVYMQPIIIMLGAVLAVNRKPVMNENGNKPWWILMQAGVLAGTLCLALSMGVMSKYRQITVYLHIPYRWICYGVIGGCICVAIQCIANLTDAWRCR